jgi:hypothetical protein
LCQLMLRRKWKKNEVNLLKWFRSEEPETIFRLFGPWPLVHLTSKKMKVDFVLVFDFCSELRLFNSNPSLAKAELSKIKNEYQNLLQALTIAGLQTTGRRGAKQGQILILVHCDDDRVRKEIERER